MEGVPIGSAGHLHHRFIETHDVTGSNKSLIAKALFQESEGALDLVIGHFAKGYAVAHDGAMNIAPHAPFLGVHGKQGPGPLLRAERSEISFGRLANRLCENPSRSDRK
jgi:hypothetical protein